MRARGCKRRFAGWTLLTLTLLTAAAWTASAEWAVEYGTDRRGIRLWNGTLYTWTIHNLFDSPTVGGVLAVIEKPNSSQLHISSGVLNSPEPAFSFTVTNLEDTWQQRWWFGLGEHATFPRSFHSFGVYECTTIPNSARLVGRMNKTVAHAIALWPVALALSAAGVTCLRSSATVRRRGLLNLCPACGYNLAGLDAAAKCPECGRANQ